MSTWLAWLAAKMAGASRPAMRSRPETRGEARIFTAPRATESMSTARATRTGSRLAHSVSYPAPSDDGGRGRGREGGHCGAVHGNPGRTARRRRRFTPSLHVGQQ